MTTAYTSLLGLALPVTGELSGTWGDTVNNSITSLVDTAVAGTTNVSADSNVTLTTTSGAANTARQAILLFSGARTAIRTVTAPAQSKIYTVINATTGGFAVQLVGAGPTTGVTIANGARTVVAWNGSDFVEVSSPSSIILPGGTANGVLYLNGSKAVTSGSALSFDGANALTLFRTTATEANEPTIRFSNLTFAGQNAGVVKSSNGGLALDIQSPSDSTFQLRSRIYMGGGSADTISFQASSNNGSTYSERMALTGTGLGIGTSSPDQTLVVNKASGSTYLKISGANNSANDLGLQFTDGTNTSYFGQLRGTLSGTAGALACFTGGAIRTVVDSSGNVGIGTTIPASYGRLAVVGNAALNTNGQLKLYNSANSNWSYIDNPSTDATAFMRFVTGAGEAARITSDGNLLVGTTGNSLAKVRVVSASNNWSFQANDIYRVFNHYGAFGSTSTTRTCSIAFQSQSSNWSGHLVEVIFAGAYDISGTVIAGKATFSVVSLTVLGVTEIEDIGAAVSFSASISGMSLIITATTTSLTNWTGWTVRVTSTNSFSAPTSISIA